jgi:hypothetical protein
LIRLFPILPHLLKILLDGGYKQGVIDWGKAMFGYVLEVVKRSELHTFKIVPKRWIVLPRTILPKPASSGRLGSTAANCAPAAGMMLRAPS